MEVPDLPISAGKNLSLREVLTEVMEAGEDI
jgi:hypothetical protein